MENITNFLNGVPTLYVAILVAIVIILEKFLTFVRFYGTPEFDKRKSLAGVRKMGTNLALTAVFYGVINFLSGELDHSNVAFLNTAFIGFASATAWAEVGSIYEHWQFAIGKDDQELDKEREEK